MGAAVQALIIRAALTKREYSEWGLLQFYEECLCT